MPENVRFGLPPEIVEAIASAPAVGAARTNVYFVTYGKILSPICIGSRRASTALWED